MAFISTQNYVLRFIQVDACNGNSFVISAVNECINVALSRCEIHHTVFSHSTLLGVWVVSSFFALINKTILFITHRSLSHTQKLFWDTYFGNQLLVHRICKYPTFLE